MGEKLSERQARFVEAYLLDPNATQAAIAAGYSEKTAHVQGPRLLDNVVVQDALTEARKDRAQKTGIDAAWVLRRLAEEAEADLGDLYNEDGSIKPMHEWPKIWRQGLVAGIKHQELRDSDGNRTGEFIIDVKISDRVKRLELIGKHVRVNAFQDVVQHKGLEGLADRMARAKARKDG